MSADDALTWLPNIEGYDQLPPEGRISKNRDNGHKDWVAYLKNLHKNLVVARFALAIAAFWFLSIQFSDKKVVGQIINALARTDMAVNATNIADLANAFVNPPATDETQTEQPKTGFIPIIKENRLTSAALFFTPLLWALSLLWVVPAAVRITADDETSDSFFYTPYASDSQRWLTVGKTYTVHSAITCTFVAVSSAMRTPATDKESGIMGILSSGKQAWFLTHAMQAYINGIKLALGNKLFWAVLYVAGVGVILALNVRLYRANFAFLAWCAVVFESCTRPLDGFAAVCMAIVAFYFLLRYYGSAYLRWNELTNDEFNDFASLCRAAPNAKEIAEAGTIAKKTFLSQGLRTRQIVLDVWGRHLNMRKLERVDCHFCISEAYWIHCLFCIYIFGVPYMAHAMFYGRVLAPGH